MKGAIAIAAGEAMDGAPAVSVEVSISDHNGHLVKRGVVTLAVAGMMLPG